MALCELRQVRNMDDAEPSKELTVRSPDAPPHQSRLGLSAALASNLVEAF